MDVYYDRSLERQEGRTHPWIDAVCNPNHRYYNFVESPELIRTSLEDFVPLGNDFAAVRFYELLEWLNGSYSLFETNDSGIRPVQPHEDPNSQRQLRTTGRLHIFLRDHRFNTSEHHILWLTRAFLDRLRDIDPGWKDGCIGVARLPTRFESIPEDQERDGYLHELHLFAYGDSERDTLDAFARSCCNVLVACRDIDARIRQDLNETD